MNQVALSSVVNVPRSVRIFEHPEIMPACGRRTPKAELSAMQLALRRYGHVQVRGGTKFVAI